MPRPAGVGTVTGAKLLLSKAPVAEIAAAALTAKDAAGVEAPDLIIIAVEDLVGTEVIVDGAVVHT